MKPYLLTIRSNQINQFDPTANQFDSTERYGIFVSMLLNKHKHFNLFIDFSIYSITVYTAG